MTARKLPRRVSRAEIAVLQLLLGQMERPVFALSSLGIRDVGFGIRYCGFRGLIYTFHALVSALLTTCLCLENVGSEEDERKSTEINGNPSFSGGSRHFQDTLIHIGLLLFQFPNDLID
jgi:hypothetical protein